MLWPAGAGQKQHSGLSEGTNHEAKGSSRREERKADVDMSGWQLEERTGGDVRPTLSRSLAELEGVQTFTGQSVRVEVGTGRKVKTLGHRFKRKGGEQEKASLFNSSSDPRPEGREQGGIRSSRWNA